MASAGTLVFELAADVSHLRTDMAKASSEMQSALDSIRESSAAEAFMTGAEYAEEFAKGFAEKIMAAIEQADALGKLAQRIGTTTEELSALTYAGKFADVSTDDLAAAFKNLNKALIDADDPMSESAQAFKAIGLNAAQLRNEDPGKAFEDIAEAFSQYKDGAEKAAVATAVFGKAGQALIPMLNEGKEGIAAARAEAESLGLIVSGTTAKAMADLNDDMTRLKNAGEGAAAIIAGQLTVSLDTLVRSVTTAHTEGDLWNTTLKFIGTTISDLILDVTSLGGEISILWKEMLGYGDAAKQFFAGDFKGALQTAADAGYKSNAAMDELTARIQKAKNLQREMSDNPIDLGNGMGGWDPEKPTAGLIKVAGAAKTAKQAVDEYGKMLDDLNKKMVTLKSGGDPMAEMLADPKFQKLAKDQQQTLIDLMNTYLDMKASMEGAKQAQTDLDKQRQQAAETNAAYLKTLQSTADAQLDAIDPLRVHEREMAQYNDMLKYTIINQQQYDALVAQSGKKWGDALKGITPMTEQTKALTEAIDGFGKQAADSFVDFATGADNAGDSFRKMIADMLTQMAKMLVYQYVFKSMFSSISSGVGSWIDQLPKAGGASVSAPVSAAPAPYAASAGTLGAPSSAAGGGSVAGGGGGGNPNSNVVVNVHVTKEDRATQDTTADTRAASDLGNRIAAAVRQVITVEKRTGGLLAPTAVR